MSSEAQARITINRLLEDAGWRFLPDGQGKRENIVCEHRVRRKVFAPNVDLGKRRLPGSPGSRSPAPDRVCHRGRRPSRDEPSEHPENSVPHRRCHTTRQPSERGWKLHRLLPFHRTRPFHPRTPPSWPGVHLRMRPPPRSVQGPHRIARRWRGAIGRHTCNPRSLPGMAPPRRGDSRC